MRKLLAILVLSTLLLTSGVKVFAAGKRQIQSNEITYQSCGVDIDLAEGVSCDYVNNNFDFLAEADGLVYFTYRVDYDGSYQPDNHLMSCFLENSSVSVSNQLFGTAGLEAFQGDRITCQIDLGYVWRNSKKAYPKQVWQIDVYQDEYANQNYSPSGLTDISLHKYRRAIEFVKEKGIISGYADHTFKPDQEINRAELLKIVMEARYGSTIVAHSDYSRDCFNDLGNPGAWYVPYACLAKKAGIISGYSDGTFRPANSITFPEALKIISVASGENIGDSGGEWYRGYVESASQKNLLPLDISGFTQLITRGQVAEMITRFLKKQDGDLDEYLGVKAPVRLSFEEIEEREIAGQLEQMDVAGHINAYRNEILRLTNLEREKEGLPALVINALLNQSAQGHAQDMARNNYFSHTSQDGREFDERISAAGYQYHYCGENLAFNQKTPVEAVSSWMGSPGHRANILNANYVDIGIGISEDANGERYWAQNFGKPME